MFRKPRAKNFSQRVRADNGEDGDGAAPSENDPESIKASAPRVASSILSFNDNEGDDEVNFKLERAVRSSTDIPSFKKQKSTSRKLQATTKKRPQIKHEEEDEEVVILKSKDSKGNQERPNSSMKMETAETIQVTSEAELDVRNKFSTAFEGIPDAKAVYEARKKREMMRHEGVPDFVPIDDTVRLKKNDNRTGERARLVREDENDMSDEDDDGQSARFYSAKSLLTTEEEQRRESQAHFLRIEQGGSDEEDKQPGSDDDELARWEHEQIRKGVSTQKVNQYQDELNATSLYYRGYPATQAGYRNGASTVEDMEMDMDVEIVDNAFVKPNINLPDAANGSFTLDTILEKIQIQVASKQEYLNTVQESLSKIEDTVNENQASVLRLQDIAPEMQQRFRMFQEMRHYTNDLLECLNEKIEEINGIENDVSTMWKKRTERLMKRRRQDVHDVYEKCQASSLGRPWVPPSAEYITREAEREARRNRRKRARELAKNADKKVESHRDGLSSDDEETTSQQVVYKDTMASALEKAAGVFVDAEDDFCRIERILNRFIDWLMVDPDSYKDAFISLCIPKILAPFIRLELLDWKPLEEPLRALESWSWYKQILSVGMNNSGLDMESPEITNIIPSVVEKVVLPKIAKMVREQWNPLSLRQSMNLSKVLNSLAADYPTVSASSKQMLDVLNSIYARAKASIEEDTFVPLYSKEAIESPASGCGAFLDQQFWNSIKLMRSLRCFRYLISDNCLEEMMIEGIVNRSVVLALQFSVITDPVMVPKCLAVLEEIPTSWFPTARPASYQSLAGLLGRVIAEHKSREREACKKLQEFVHLCRKELPT